MSTQSVLQVAPSLSPGCCCQSGAQAPPAVTIDIEKLKGEWTGVYNDHSCIIRFDKSKTLGWQGQYAPRGEVFEENGSMKPVQWFQFTKIMKQVASSICLKVLL